MTKIELLLDAAANLRNLADVLWKIAEAIEASETPESQVPAPAEAPAAEPVAKPVTLEEVRAVLAEKSHDGFTAEVRSLLEKHGASKLSEIDPSRYAALLADAEELK